MKKASIQLSVNFLVILIISIVIMSFGFVLLRSVMVNQGEAVLKMDDKLQNQIESMLDKGGTVSIPLIQKEGERGGFVQFGVGVTNLEGSIKDFGVYVEFDNAVNLDGTNEPEAPELYIIPGVDLTNDGATKSIFNNERAFFVIPIKIPKGSFRNVEYVYNVYVCVGNPPNILNDGGKGCGSEFNKYKDKVYKIYVKVT